MQQVLIGISTILAIISPVIYVKAILKGEAKPHRTTRLVLLLISSLTTASLFAQHDRVAIWLAAVSTLQSIFIFFLSIKYGMGGWGKADIVCLGISIFGIILWKTTSNPTLALYAAIAADCIGMIPAIIKTYKFPETEVWSFYALDVVAALFTLFALRSWTLQEFSYPVYIFFINAFMVLLIRRKRI